MRPSPAFGPVLIGDPDQGHGDLERDDPVEQHSGHEPGERTGRYRAGRDQLLADDSGNSTISIEDYAVAVIDELERPQAVGRRLSVAY